ncbi:MAG: hypothetical protein IT282_06970 [Bacteroidetes bacterium]|nr:hypothetical protein [Bacteroidota bacterium]
MTPLPENPFRRVVARVRALARKPAPQGGLPYRDRFSQFTREALAKTDQADLAKAVSAFLTKWLSASHVDLLVADAAGTLFGDPRSPGRALSSSVLPADGHIRAHQLLKVDQLAESSSPRDRDILANVRGGYVIPLMGEKSPMALLLIGGAKSGGSYTPDEMEFLTMFADGVSMAVERNSLMERMRSEQVRVSKMEKLAFLGRMTAGIAHEFRNPLNIISTSAQTILRHPEDSALHVETGRYILEETERLNRTVDEFLQFAKPHAPVWERVPASGVIESALEGLKGLAAEKGIQIETSVRPPDAFMTTSPRHLERVLRNLGLNAIEAMSRGGTLTFNVHPLDRDAITIAVGDTGPGIPAQYHAQLFDPFFTTKSDGTGLGLAIVFMLIQTLRGKITFTSNPRGTTFLIELPIDGSQK